MGPREDRQTSLEKKRGRNSRAVMTGVQTEGPPKWAFTKTSKQIDKESQGL